MKKIFLYISLITLVSCSCFKSEDTIAVYYSKSKCFGKCSVFNLTIYDSGNAIYEGVNNVSNIGKYSFILTGNELDDIKRVFVENKYDTLDDEYLENNKRDLQKYTLNYNSKEIVFHKMNAPSNLSNITDFLDDKIEEGKFIKLK